MAKKLQSKSKAKKTIKFSCQFPSCEKYYKNRVSLYRHEGKSHPNWEKPRKLRGAGGFPCNDCKKEYSSSEALRKHGCSPFRSIRTLLIEKKKAQEAERKRLNEEKELEQKKRKEELQTKWGDDDDVVHFCPVCKVNRVGKYKLLKHIEIKHPLLYEAFQNSQKNASQKNSI